MTLVWLQSIADFHKMQDILPSSPTSPCTCRVRQLQRCSSHIAHSSPQRTPNNHTPRLHKNRRLSDPFQVFKVEQQQCLLLHVKVLQGRQISGGWVADMLHKPCPSVELVMKNAAEPKSSTCQKEGEVNPQWKENFTFYLDSKKDNRLEVTLYDNHAWYGGPLGTITIHVSELILDVTEKRTLHFNSTSEIDIELRVEFDANPTLRYSLCLPDEEKCFRKCRRAKTFEAMKKILGKRAPDNISQTPTVAVIGSGGGFRAMVGFAGAVKALSETGVLDCTTYIGSLSGSSWYLSQLYAHPAWARGDVATVNTDLRAAIDHTFLWLLSPAGLYTYMHRLRAKRAAGLPVSFTDLFGHLVGDTILKGRMTSRLSDQRSLVEKGMSPLPLYTCVHVKKDISARVFQEWMEFSPYEIGLPKYGIFMKSHLFGSKFFMGKVIKQFPEQPLHYLQGIWGSAFCILFRRLLQRTGADAYCGRRETNRRAPKRSRPKSPTEEVIAPKWRRQEEGRRTQVIVGKKPTQGGYLGTLLEKICTSSRLSLLSTRTARAGVIHNPLRGLSLQRTFPFSPFSQMPPTEPVSANDEFNGLFDLHPTSEEHLYLVDAGLTFNSPYPVVLRPQRAVDVILSFDFSARKTDNAPPFKELLLAERWARLNGAPFPPVDVNVWDPENPQEVYVFRHPTDPSCPVILHFVLVNSTFRQFKEPGVERDTEEEKRFGDFSLFDDPASPYSTFTFTYAHESFDRLSRLMEYNTRRHVSLINDVMAERVERNRKHAAAPPTCLLGGDPEFKLAPIKMAKNKFKSKRSMRE